MTQTPPPSQATSPGPLRCLTGSAISAALAIAFYFLMRSIATAFATNPPTGNATAISIGVAVRTLVLGIAALGTGIFSLTALGLVGLAIQTTVQGWGRSSDSTH